MISTVTRGGLLLALLMSWSTVSAQSATVYTVNDIADAVDANVGDGICADSQDRCTLRAAVDEANATSGEVVINLPGQLAGGASGTYTLSQVAPNDNDNTFEDANQYGDLDIGLQRMGTGTSATTSAAAFTSLAIRGTGTPGPQLTISPNDRVVDLHNGEVTISRVTITGGNSRPGRNGSNPDVMGNAGEDGADGGGVLVRMGVTATLEQVSLNNNATGSGGNGAAPAMAGTDGGDAGNGGNGGGVANFGTLTVRKSFVSQNTAGDAGGAANGTAGSGQAVAGGAGGAGGSGAGIFNAGTLTVEQSTINGNTAGTPSDGAAGTNGGDDGTEGEGGAGGGIASVNGGTATISGSIIASNNAGDDVQNAKQPGSDLYDGSIADDDIQVGDNPFMAGSFTDNGFNLIGTNNSVDGLFTADTGQSDTNGDDNIVGSGQQADATRVDPVITGANRNATYAVTAYELGANSPAIDAGNPAITEELDGRGFRRPERSATDSNADQIADIGAFERDSEPVMVPLVISEFDTVTTPAGEDDASEFIEIRNDGEFTAQLADYVLVLFRGDNGATPEETVEAGAEDAAYFQINLTGELAPGESYLVGENMNADLTTSFAGMMDASDGFDDDDGAVALYTGKASDYPDGAAAGQNAQTRVDVIVYDNGAQASRLAKRDASSLAGAFGVPEEDIASGDDEGTSIQRTASGGTTTGTPSPSSSANGGAAGQPGDVVINEIDYDQVGTDNAEFIELYNAGSQSVDLSQLELRLIQGAGQTAGTAYETVTFDPGTTIPAMGYYVVCGNTANVANCDDGDQLPASNAIQNGPDAVELVTTGGTRIDVVSYEAAVMGFTEGGGAAPADLGTTGNENMSIARTPDGADTDDNAADFSVVGITPGAQNLGETLQQTTDGADRWVMLASPVSGTTYDDMVGPFFTQCFDGADYNADPCVPDGTLGTGGFEPNVLIYDQAIDGYAEIGNQTDVIPDGEGYIFFVYLDDENNGPSDDQAQKTITVSGDPRDTDVTVSGLEAGDDALLGNPFATAIDSDDFLTGMTNPNAGFLQVVYVWDPAISDYRTWNGMAGNLPDGLIAPLQGFYVESDTGTSFTIPTAARTGEQATFYGRQQAPQTVRFVLGSDDRDAEAEAFMSFTPDGQVGPDTRDAKKFRSLSSDYLSLALGQPETNTALSIANLPNDLTERVSFPLAVRSVEEGQFTGGTFTLRWPELTASESISFTLVDNETGARTDLRNASEYTFRLTAEGDAPAGPSAQGQTQTVENGRFELVLNDASTVSSEAGTLAEAYALSAAYPNPLGQSAQLVLQVRESQPVTAEVFDMLGRKVATLFDGTVASGARHTLQVDASQWASGAYIVRVSGEAFSETRRITVVR